MGRRHEGSCCQQPGFVLGRGRGVRCCTCSQGPRHHFPAEMLLGCSWLFCCPPQGLGMGKGWPGANPCFPSLTPLFPDDHAGGGGVPRVAGCCRLPAEPRPKAVSGWQRSGESYPAPSWKRAWRCLPCWAGEVTQRGWAGVAVPYKTATGCLLLAVLTHPFLLAESQALCS